MVADPEVAVIVPSYNGAHLLSDLLPSLAAQTLQHDVVVVDNGSRDGTIELLEEEFPWVTLVRLSENGGFARAANRGVAACGASSVVFVNNDVVCEPSFLQRLCAPLDPPDGVVMTAAVLLMSESPDRIDTAGIEVDRTLLAFDHLHSESVDVLEDCVPDPFGASGGAGAFDRVAFDRLGGFDERFFAYLEDVDLAARMRAAGGRCRLARDARGVHRHSATLGSGSRDKNRLMGWSRGYMIGKYRLHGHPALIVRTAAVELVIATGQIAFDRTAVGFSARAAGFRAGLRVPCEKLPPLPASAVEMTLAGALGRRLRRRR